MPGPRLGEAWGERIGDVMVNCRDGVVTALIDRPAARNAINSAVVEGIAGAVHLACEHDARVMVIRGAGGTFCAGADLRELVALRAHPEQTERFMACLGAALDRVESVPFPVVAVVDGHAVAGGLELLLVCDVVIAATTALIGDRHLEYGLVPAAGSSVRLSCRLPSARANYLLLSADMLTGEEAARWGLVTHAVPPEDLELFAGRVISRLASRSKSAAATVKTMARKAREMPTGEALRHERALFMNHIQSRDAAEGLAAFLEHRVPDFTAQDLSQEGHRVP